VIHGVVSFKKIHFFILFTFILFLFPLCQAFAADTQTIPVLIAQPAKGGAVAYGLSIKILIVMTVLTVLPALLITMSAFTRIIIVLAIARQAVGVPSVPNNQILIGLSLIMTLFVMMPVLQKMNDTSLQPYLNGQITELQALDGAGDSLKLFLLKQTRKADLKVFANLAKVKVSDSNDYSLLVIMPAFITSELKTAFEIGFLILLPFLIIDIVVASILMSMGMMMLSPMVISLPFKIIFFVLVNGWSLIITSLITSFRI
jgi:flagellar biosynthetic protein FliP